MPSADELPRWEDTAPAREARKGGEAHGRVKVADTRRLKVLSYFIELAQEGAVAVAELAGSLSRADILRRNGRKAALSTVFELI